MTRVIEVTEPRLYEAIERFLVQFATPPVPDDGRHVIPGYADDQTLPEGDNEFFVYAPVSSTRQGTNIEQWHDTEDVTGQKEYVETVIQVDCYSASPVYAMRRAQTIETMTRSEPAVRFLADYGVNPLYADAPRNLSRVIDSGRYVSRWAVDIHVGYWRRVDTQVEYFTSAQVDVQNVDVRYPPR
jgi:hypothetical protein